MDSALLTWVQLFRVGRDVNEIVDMRDGKVLAEILADLHPDYAVDDKRLITDSDKAPVREMNQLEVVNALEKVYQGFRKEIQLHPMVKEAETEKDRLRAIVKLLVASTPFSHREDELADRLSIYEDEKDTLCQAITEVLDKLKFDLMDFSDDELNPHHFIKAYDPNSTTQRRARRISLSHTRCAADYEEEIKQLQSEITRLQRQRDQAREEVAALKEELLDKTDRVDLSPQASPRSPYEGKVNISMVANDLQGKDERIKELENIVEEYREKEREWQHKEDELQIAKSMVAEGKQAAQRLRAVRKMKDQLLEKSNDLQQRLEKEMETNVKVVKEAEKTRTELKVVKETLEKVSFEKVEENIAKQGLAEKVEQLSQDKDSVEGELQQIRQQLLRISDLEEQLSTKEKENENMKLHRIDKDKTMGRVKALKDSRRRIRQLYDDLRRAQRSVEIEQRTKQRRDEVALHLAEQGKVSEAFHEFRSNGWRPPPVDDDAGFAPPSESLAPSPTPRPPPVPNLSTGLDLSSICSPRPTTESHPSLTARYSMRDRSYDPPPSARLLTRSMMWTPRAGFEAPTPRSLHDSYLSPTQ